MNWLKDNFGFILICVGFFACTRGSDEVNKTVKPDSQQFTTTFTDTSTVKASTILFDKSISNNSFRMLIGGYTHPDFGKIASNAYFQFILLPDSLKTTLGPNPKYASIFLELDFSTTVAPSNIAYGYGQKSVPQAFKIFKINDPAFGNISVGGVRLNSSTFTYSDLLAEFTVYDKIIEDSKIVTGTVTSTISRLSIKLSDLIGQELISNADAFSSNDKLLSILNGIYIESSASNTCVWGIENAQIRVNYYNYFGSNNIKVDEVLYLTLNRNLQSRIRSLTADRSSSSLSALSKDYDEINNDDNCYVQASTGVCTKISFPHLLDLKKKIGVEKLVINRAELVITPDLTDAGAYPVPSNLYFYEFDTDGKSIPSINPNLPSIKTNVSEGEASDWVYFLSYYLQNNHYIVKRTDSDNPSPDVRDRTGLSQTANVTRFVQSIMDGKTNPEKSLVLASDGLTYYAVVPNYYSEVNQLKISKKNLKLKLYYTPYP